jgi:hypothetical protein
MGYGDDIAASNGFEPGDEDDEFSTADFDDDEFDPDDDDDDDDWDDDEEDKPAGRWDSAAR